MTKYQIRLPDTTVEVEATVVNLGLRKLWFWDEESRLIAVFVWEKIVGFEVVGSIQDQKFTDDLLHEQKTRDQKMTEEIQQKGELWAKLRDVHRKLHDVSSAMNTPWLQIYDARRNNTTETSLLVERHEADLRQVQAQILDDQKSVNSRVQSILREFAELLPEKNN